MIVTTHHMFFQETQETLTINWSLNDVVCDDAIKSDGRNDRKSCTAYKAPLDATINTSHQLPMLAGGCSFILGSFINKNKHI